jgi:AraC-like DNA-binding protein/mannose-6-phosphate isomerase-like protein (cupin superfamily)
MFGRHKSENSSPWRKLVIIPGSQNGTFELKPGQDCGKESYRDFDVWIGLEGRATVHLLGHEIELQKDRMILVPPGVTIRLCGQAGHRLKMIYTHFDCLLSGRRVCNARACVSAANLTLTLQGLPTVALVAEIDSATVSQRLTQTSRSFSADLANMTLSLLYLEIWRRLRETYLSPRDTLSIQRLEKAMNYFESKLDQKITLAETARYASVSPETLGRLFRVHYKTSPMHLLQRMRLTRARDLLHSGRFNISEAGYAAGFSSPQYFSRAFKQAYDMTPFEFLKTPGRIP